MAKAVPSTSTQLVSMFEAMEVAGKIKESANTHGETPDMPWLNRWDGHVLFTYGTLKTGFNRSYILKEGGGKFLCSACTIDEHAMLYTLGRDRFPVLLEETELKNQARAIGELWVVPTSLLSYLDTIESNGVLYQRTPKRCQVMTKPTNPKFQLFSYIDTWTYIGMESTWLNDVALGESGQVIPGPFGLPNNGEETCKTEFLNFSLAHENDKYAFEGITV